MSLLAGILGAFTVAVSPPTLTYTLHLDPAQLDVAHVEIQVRDAPATFHLAMRVHAEYDARYWRYIDSLGVQDGTHDAAATVTREDSTLWRVTLPGGSGVVRYRVHIQPARTGRRAWLPYTRFDGALINSSDFFLYVPELPRAQAAVDLDIPRDWRVATALAARGSPTRRSAPDAVTLLDSPILLGLFKHWSFSEGGTRYHVVYWPLPAPDATPFDTAAFVDELHRLTRAALAIFGRAPAGPDYYFLIQDGASDALEHAASLTMGVTSATLARDPRASLTEIAHEFFHTWNLVAIHPAGYNALSYRAPARTPGLWVGEGITMYYADALPRRVGLTDSTHTRLDHLADLLQRYYGSPAIMHVPPERASLAFGDSPVTNPDATGGYYLQGELLGSVLDALVRDSTHDRRGLDDVMRALFERSLVRGDSGFTSYDVASLTDSVCACRMTGFFATQVREAGPIDVVPVLHRLGLRLILDSVPAVDSSGLPLPDLRLGIDFTAPAGVVRVVVSHAATPWATAGIRTGDEVLALSGAPVRSAEDLRATLRSLRVGDHVTVEFRRGSQPMSVIVLLTGYVRPRVRFVDPTTVTEQQRARRQAWTAGR